MKKIKDKLNRLDGGKRKGRKSQGRKKKEIIKGVGIQDFVSGVEKLTEHSAQGWMNCFALLFIEQTLREIGIFNSQDQSPSKGPETVFFVSHQLPVWQMNSLPLFNAAHGEIHGLVPALEQKKSFLIRRILELSRQMPSCLDKISAQEGLPFPSAARIFSVMVRRPDECSFDRIVELCQENETSTGLHYFDSVFVRNDIPLPHRDELLIRVCRKIHNLVVEALIVVMAAGWSELSAIQKLKAEGAEISIIKDHIQQIACCTWLERQLLESGNETDLDRSLEKEFFNFGRIITPLLLSIDEQIYKTIPRYAHLLKEYEFQLVPKIKDVYVDGMPEEAKSAYLSLVSSRQDEIKEMLKDDKKDSGYRALNFPSEVKDAVRRKFFDEPLKTYSLSGDPANILAFIYTVVNNCCKQIIEDEQKTIPGHDISYRTLRRYDRELKTGVLDGFLQIIGKLGSVKSVGDLSEDELDLLISYKSEKMVHSKEDCMTQNDLIKYLRNPEVRESLNKKGITLKLYSEPTLKKKLKRLIELGQVQVEKAGRAFHFRKDDKEEIARAIADL